MGAAFAGRGLADAGLTLAGGDALPFAGTALVGTALVGPALVAVLVAAALVVVAFVGGRLVAVGAGGLTARPVALAGFAGAAALTAFVVLAGVDRAAARAGRALPAATGLLAATALLALPVLGIVTAPRGERLRTLPRGSDYLSACLGEPRDRVPPSPPRPPAPAFCALFRSCWFPKIKILNQPYYNGTRPGEFPRHLKKTTPAEFF